MRAKERIGLLGGTFDPVHRGHLAIAEQLLKGFFLDSILFIPAARPPHKRQPVTSFSHRVAMLETALAGMERMSVSLLESERSSRSYTIDTILELHNRLGPLDYFLIIGADAFVEMHLWYRYAELLTLTDCIVVARPGFPLAEIEKEIGRLPGNFVYDHHDSAWQHQAGRRIFYFSLPHEMVSSTEIRSRLALGRPVDRLLPCQVARYIRRHGLYKSG